MIEINSSIDQQSVQHIIETCGTTAEKFNWTCGLRVLSALKLYEVLNFMPNLNHIKFAFNGVFQNISEEKFDQKLSLKNLKSLEINTRYEEVFEIFSSLLPENSLTECFITFTLEWILYIDDREMFDRVNEKFIIFFDSQKSIKKLKINIDPIFIEKAIETLSLDELESIHENLYNQQSLIYIVERQPALKILKLTQNNIISEFFEQICKLSRLEFLYINVYHFTQASIKNWNLLSKLENLKKLAFFGGSPDYGWSFDDADEFEKTNLSYESFIFAKNDSLQKLSIAGYFCADLFQAISENFPNLKELGVVHSEQKLNFFAKCFPNLDKLYVRFEHNLLMNEFNTGIVNENLKVLTIDDLSESFNNHCENFMEIVEIFPNLEVLNILGLSLKVSNFFFSKIKKLKKLKAFEMENLLFNQFLAFSENFKILAENIEKITLKVKCFENKILTEEQKEKFETFKNDMKSHFDVTETEEIRSDYCIKLHSTLNNEEMKKPQ